MAILLSVKLIATVILLRQKRQFWFARRSGVVLWWSAKIIPLVATPGLITIAVLGYDEGAARVYRGLMLFVLVAVPITMWRQPAYLREWMAIRAE